MNTIKLYAIEITKAFMMCEQGEGFSLQPWGDNTLEYEGNDDGGKQYVLPPGYELSETKYGESAIFDEKNNYCNIVKHECGRPQLVSSSRSMPVLKLA